MCDEYLEALAAEGSCGLLVARWQRWGDGQVIANEQRHRFGHDRGIAIKPIELAADPIETPDQRAVAAGVAVGIEEPVEGCVDNRRAVGPGSLCRKRKPFGNMIGQID